MFTLQSTTPLLDNAQDFLQCNPHTVIAATTVAPVATAWMLDNYSKYISLGEGGFYRAMLSDGCSRRC